MIARIYTNAAGGQLGLLDQNELRYVIAWRARRGPHWLAATMSHALR